METTKHQQKPPTKVNLAAFSTNDDDDEEPKEVWAISTPKKNSLFWSILVPYLITAVENGTFHQSIKLLIGENPDEKLRTMSKNLNIDVIEKRVKNINSFINYHTLYFDDNLIALMRILKRRLNQMAGDSSKNHEVNNRKLEAAVNILTCSIDLYEEITNQKSLRSFTPPSSSQKSKCSKIIIFSQVQPPNFIYGFGLTSALKLQASALKRILKTAGLRPGVISEIVKLLPCERLLLALIKSPCRQAIPTIFKSPYILKKLSDAGYDLNPLATGENDVTAFYDCILLNDWNLFHVLYKHASSKDYFHQGNAPEDDIIKKLTTIRDKISNDFRSEDFSNRETAQRMYHILMRFNEYHFQIEKGVASIRHDSEAQISDKLTKTVLFIIDKYAEYFHYASTDSELDKYEDYFQNYEYHKMVDDLTCLCFFDHFLSLKVLVDKRNKNVFIEVLASLFLYFLSKLKFDKDTFFPDSANSNAETKAKYFVVFCYRMRWHKALSALSQELSIGLPESKDPNIIKIVESCLVNYPLIKEEFSMARLQMYLKISEKADFSGNATKAALVLLRTLQVIGETFCSTKIGCSATPLLEYCIPPNVVKALCDIRNNCLSHLHASFTQGRKELERSSLLSEIQNELKDVATIFEPIFAMQAFRVSDFMITYGIEESRKFGSDLFKKLNDMKTEISDLEQKHYGNHEDKYIAISSVMLDLIPESATNKHIKTYDRLVVHCEGLKHLLLYVAKHSNCCEIEDFIQEIDEIDNLNLERSHENVSEDSIKEINKVFSGLKRKFIAEFDRAKVNPSGIPFPNLNAIFKTVKEHNIFSTSDQSVIRKSFTEFLETSEQQIIDYVNSDRILSNADLDACLKCLIKDKNARTQVKQGLKKKTAEALTILHNNICSVETVLGSEEETCFKLMTALNDDIYRAVIPQLCLPKSIHDKLNDLKNQKLDFVMERLYYLEEILIDDNDYIKNSMVYGTSLEYRDYTKRLIMLRYIAEMDTKAGLEMLLLDCLEIFNKKDAFKNLWLKSTDLFLGISIRDILSHGCPILEVSNKLLDHDNLPMEFINIALELIEDQKVLKALIEISRNTKCSAKELKSFIENNTDDKFSDLKKTIVRNGGRWERYLFLFTN